MSTPTPHTPAVAHKRRPLDPRRTRTRRATARTRFAAAAIAPLVLAGALGACGDDVEPVQAGTPPVATSRDAHAAAADRYVAMQLDRAAEAAVSGPASHRTAQAAAAERYVTGLEHRAATAGSPR